jgi:hypothetical protein
VALEAAVAVPDELDGQGIDAGVARELTQCELRKLAVVARGQVATNVRGSRT